METDSSQKQKPPAVWVLVAVGLFVAWCVWQQKNVQQEIRETQRQETVRRENDAAALAIKKAEIERLATSPQGQWLQRRKQQGQEFVAIKAEFDQLMAKSKAVSQLEKEGKIALDPDLQQRVNRLLDLQMQMEILVKSMQMDKLPE